MASFGTRILPFLLAIVTVFLVTSCASTGPAGSERAARNSIANIKGGLEAHWTEYGSWPSSLSALQSYAVSKGRSIDLSPFSKMTLRRHSANTVLVEFVTLPPQSRDGGFSVSKFDVN